MAADSLIGTGSAKDRARAVLLVTSPSCTRAADDQRAWIAPMAWPRDLHSATAGGPEARGTQDHACCSPVPALRPSALAGRESLHAPSDTHA